LGESKLEKAQILKASQENLEWFKDNYEALKKDYDNQWIIVQKREVVAKGSTFEQIKKCLQKMDRKSALVEFVDSNNLAMFF
jgi:hypothetical protein